jgi:hypothetical protein
MKTMEISLVFNSGFMASFWFMKECFPYLKESKGKSLIWARHYCYPGFSGLYRLCATKESRTGFKQNRRQRMGTSGNQCELHRTCCGNECTGRISKGNAEWSATSGTPMKIGSPVLLRKGRPEEDIGRVAVFLSSEDASTCRATPIG